MSSTIRVFIENEAGSCRKHRHNETTLEHVGSSRVARSYPYPYGFILDTTAADGMRVDCFVITDRALATGTIVEGVPIGLMEQIDQGEEDHNVLARLSEEDARVTVAVRRRLVDFVRHVFDHRAEKEVRVGRLLDADAAREHIARHAT